MKKLGKSMLACLLIICLLPWQMLQVHAAEKEVTLPVYKIYPTPQEISYETSMTELGEANVVFESGIDDATKNHVSDVLNLKGISMKTSNGIVSGKMNVLVGINGSGEYADTYANTNIAHEESFFSETDAYILRVKDGVITVIGKDTDAAFYGITSLKWILQQAEGNSIRDLRMNDYTDTAYRGFIEGFYGIPYSNENRMDLMEFCSDFKMNTYIFAPKDDPYHNTQWRESYPQDVLDNKMKPLIQKGAETKNRFIYAIHPFQSSQMTMETSDADIQLIIDKFEQLYTLGVRQFALLADDAYSPTEVQIKAINALNNWVKQKDGTYPLVFCPQNYSGDPSWSADYFRTIDAGISKDVEIMHTGPAIIGNIDEATNNNFLNLAGREPYIWMNWPVNDYTDSTLFIGKAEMMRKGVKNFRGLVSNPMCEAQLSKIGLFQIADYGWNCDDFNVDQSWADSFQYVDPDSAEDLAVLAKHMSYPRDGVYHQTGLAWDESEELAPFLEEFSTKLKAGEDITAISETLIQEFNRIKDAGAGVMAKSSNETLKNELRPYLQSLNATLDANLNIVTCALDIAKGDMNGAWEQYSNVASNIQKSDSVTKPGLKPEGNVNLEVKPATKYLRPFARTMSAEIGKELNDAIGMAGGSGGSVNITPYVHIAQWGSPSAEELAKLCDGDDTTYMSFQSGIQKEGDYYGVDLGTVSKVNHISILQGSSDSDHDMFHYGVVEVSADEKEWKTVGDYTETAAGNKIELNVNGEKARYIRFRLTREGFNNKPDYWLHVREMSVELGSNVELFTNTNAAGTVTEEGGRVALQMDGTVTLNKNEYFGIKLPNLMPVAVTGTVPEGLTLQISENAKNWANASTEKAVARYIRYVNLSENAVTVAAPELTAVVDTISAPAVSVEGTSLDGTDPEAIFDGSEATQSAYDASKITIDIGQTISISNIDISVAEDVSDSRLLGKAEIQLSSDGNTWETVRNYDVSDKGKFDKHQAPYFYINTSLESAVNARYIRIANETQKQLVLNEVIVNKGKELPSTTACEVILDGGSVDGFGINKVYDGKLDTYYRGNTSEVKGGSITYRFTNEQFPKNITVVQNANTISNASLEVQKLDGSWEQAGSLDKSVNVFDLSTFPNALAARITWAEGTEEFYLHEIFYGEMDKAAAVKAAVEGIQAKDYTQYNAEDVAELKDYAQQLQTGEPSMSNEEVAKTFAELAEMEKNLRPAQEVKNVTVTLKKEGAGTVSGGGEVKAGTTVTIEAKPADGYTFEGWKADNAVVSTETVYSFKATENITLTAIFEKIPEPTPEKATVTVAAGEGGTVSGGGTYEVGTQISVTATEKDGYMFVAWKDGQEVVSTEKTYTFEVKKDITLTAEFRKEEVPTKDNITYQVHVENLDWQNWVKNGQLAGTSGMGLRLEGIRIKLDQNTVDGGLQYRTQIQDVGWQDYVNDGELSGTTGCGLRLEAIQIQLTGKMSEKYDIYYRTHIQDYGWLGWAKNGEKSGSAGLSKRLEGIEIQLVEKGQEAPGSTENTYMLPAEAKPSVSYQAHVQNIGWQEEKTDGQMSGTTGGGLRLEGIQIHLNNDGLKGSIQYRTQIQNIGWQDYVENGDLSGTTGRNLRLEAIQIQLTSEMAKKYDVYYRTHIQDYGWLGWAKNGEKSGSAGLSKRLEAIEIQLVPKGQAAPGNTENPYMLP